MLRYDATSAVSDSRPRPGTIHVPPCDAILGNRQIEDVIEAVDHALDRAALGRVDQRIADRREQVAGGDDLGVAEEHEAVAVGVGGLRVIEDDRLAVHVLRQLVELVEERVASARPLRERPAPCRAACSSR